MHQLQITTAKDLVSHIKIHISLIGGGAGGVSCAIFPCFQPKMVVKASVLLNNN